MEHINRFDNVKVNLIQEERIDRIRYIFDELTKELELITQSSRETSLGYTKLEEAAFWFIKGISREVDSND